MKFIGGSHHGRDVPFPLQVAIYSQRRQWIEIDARGAGPVPSALDTGLQRRAHPERYRVVSCRSADGRTTTVLAREGLGRQAFEAFAHPAHDGGAPTAR